LLDVATAVVGVLTLLERALAGILTWPVGSWGSGAVLLVGAWARADALAGVLAGPDGAWWWWALLLVGALLRLALAVGAWVSNWSRAVFGISANLGDTAVRVLAGWRPEATWWRWAILGVTAGPVDVGWWRRVGSLGWLVGGWADVLAVLAFLIGLALLLRRWRWGGGGGCWWWSALSIVTLPVLTAWLGSGWGHLSGSWGNLRRGGGWWSALPSLVLAVLALF